jgi:hypothetical protein
MNILAFSNQSYNKHFLLPLLQFPENKMQKILNRIYFLVNYLLSFMDKFKSKNLFFNPYLNYLNISRNQNKKPKKIV